MDLIEKRATIVVTRRKLLKNTSVGLVGLASILTLVAPQVVRADNAATLVGGWRVTDKGPGGEIRTTDTILQANNTFSQTTSQGPYMLYFSGTYKAVDGNLQFHVINWSPRFDAQGKPINASDWVLTYRIVDQNHVQLFNGSGNSVTAVRIR